MPEFNPTNTLLEIFIVAILGFMATWLLLYIPLNYVRGWLDIDIKFVVLGLNLLSFIFSFLVFYQLMKSRIE